MIGRVARRVRVLLGRARFEREMADEMRHHLEMEIRDRIERGMDPVEARRTALRDFGGEDRWKEAGRAARGLDGWDALTQDLRYALRSLRSAPGFAFVAVGTLAVGIGAVTAVFTVVNGLLLRPLGYPSPERVVRLFEYREDLPGTGTISAPNFHDWMASSTTFESGSLYDEYAPTLALDGETLKLSGASVNASYFDVLGLDPALGRFFLPEEDEPGSARVVLSHGLWQEAFGQDPGVLDRTVSLNGFPYTVVGVAPPLEDPGLSGSGSEPPRLWRSTPSYFEGGYRSGRSFTAIARLRPDATLEQAQAELSAIHAALAERFPDENRGYVVRAVPLLDDMVGDVRPALWMLAAAVALVLLVACANVANLLLFRAAARGREISLRSALGATRVRVVRQLMTESLVLALLGAAGGVLLALGLVRWLVELAGGQLPRAGSVAVDPRVMAFAVAAAAGAAVVFGLVPALHTARVDLRGALSGGGRGTGGGSSRGRLRAWMVSAQVALAVVVMLGAGLLGRSLLRLEAVDPGIAATETVVLRLSPPPDPYDVSTDEGEAELLLLYRRLSERLAALPAVLAVGMTDLLPMTGSFNGNGFTVVGRPEPGPGEVPSVETRAIDAGFLEAFDVPLLRGRGLLSSDDGDAEPVLLVSDGFSRTWFPDGDALGEQIRIFGRDAAPARIVGVVGDVTQFGLDAPPDPVVYVSFAQAPDFMKGEPWIVLRTGAEPASLIAAARAAVREVEPRAPVYAAKPMAAVVSSTLARPRFRTVLLLAFAGLAFVLAATGVYGMVSYDVALRTPELGVRMAMGAGAHSVARHVVVRGLGPVVVGALIGTLGGAVAGRLLATFLFGVGAGDPLTFALVPLLSVAVAALAGWLPARRAARLSPAAVLRQG